MKKTRILLLGSGASIHLERWAEALAEVYEVAIFSLEPYDPSFVERCSPRVVFYGGTESGWPKNLRCVLSVPEVRRIVRKCSADVLIAHYASSYGLLGRLVGFLPLITCAWGSDVFDFPRRHALNRWLLKGNLNAANRLVASSKALGEEMGKYSSRRVEIVPFGVDTSVFVPVEKSERSATFRIGIAKRIEEVSGIDRALKLMARMGSEPGREIQLVVAGDGSSLGEYQRLAVELGVDSMVEWRGWMPHSRLSEFYQQCDLLVFPSREESFGVSAVEAMACGKPVITSDAPGFLETVDSGTTGVVCNFSLGSGIDEMVEASRSYMADPVLLKRHGCAARERACKLYSWDRCVVQMTKIIDAVVKESVAEA